MRVRVTPDPNAFKRLRTRTEALRISDRDFAGPVLTELGVVHRKQEKNIFATEGTTGASGLWPRLTKAYAKRKKRAGYGNKVLVRTGDMKKRLTMPSHPAYYQDFEKVGPLAVFLFGAFSNLAGYHRRGSGSLPAREMLNKTVTQIAAFQKAVRTWYIEKRIPQAMRHRVSR